MKKVFSLTAIAMLLIAASPQKKATDIKIIGAWQIVRSQYGDSPMGDQKPGESVIKMFTGTRWSGTFYNTITKKFDGTGGGTYAQKGDQYQETLEYFSWDSTAVGKTFTFTLRIENGMLHQRGTIEYKGNPKYLIDEWYKRVD